MNDTILALNKATKLYAGVPAIDGDVRHRDDCLCFSRGEQGRAREQQGPAAAHQRHRSPEPRNVLHATAFSTVRTIPRIPRRAVVDGDRSPAIVTK